MNQLTRKVFNLPDIRYRWLLIISMGIFIASLYNEKINPEITLTIQLATYGSAIVSAVVWGILNYIDHIKVSANYKKYDNIDAYVDNLIMSSDERTELKAYLEDYAKDLVSQGKTKEEAVKMAINQFRVKEFTELSKNSSLLNLPIHYYLVGYTVITIILGIILYFLTHTVFLNSFWLLSVELMLFSYGVGFVGLFFLYKLMDIVLSKKIQTGGED